MPSLTKSPKQRYDEWTFKAVATGRGNEFIAHRFRNTLTELGVDHRYVTRSQTNGKVEQVHNTIRRELWNPQVARHEPRSVIRLREALNKYHWQ